MMLRREDDAPSARAALNVRTHCRASNAVGLNTAGSSRPLPHSTLVNVFGPKCTKALVSMRCHATCAGDGTGASGTGASPARGAEANSPALQRQERGKHRVCVSCHVDA